MNASLALERFIFNSGTYFKGRCKYPIHLHIYDPNHKPTIHATYTHCTVTVLHTFSVFILQTSYPLFCSSFLCPFTFSFPSFSAVIKTIFQITCRSRKNGLTQICSTKHSKEENYIKDKKYIFLHNSDIFTRVGNT